MQRYVWHGVYLALGLSLILGASIWLVYGTLTKATHVLFEGSTALLAVIFGYTVKAEWVRLIVHLTYLIVAIPLVMTAYRGKVMLPALRVGKD